MGVRFSTGRGMPGVQRFGGRMMNVGDPGLFSFIGKALGSVAKVGLGAVGGLLTGGPLGAVAGGLGATGLFGGGVKAATPTFAAPISPVPLALPGGMPILLPQGFGPSFPVTTTTATNGAAAAAGGCPPGHHLVNRMGAGGGLFTSCAKNRRINPLNPRAASRAMRRLASAKKAASFLNRFSIRSAGCGCHGKRSAAAPKSKKRR